MKKIIIPLIIVLSIVSGMFVISYAYDESYDLSVELSEAVSAENTAGDIEMSGIGKHSYQTYTLYPDLLNKMVTGEIDLINHKNIFDYYTTDEIMTVSKEELIAFCDSVWQAEGGGCVFHFANAWVVSKTTGGWRYVEVEYPDDHFLNSKYYLDGKLYDTEADFNSETWFGDKEGFYVPEVGASCEYTNWHSVYFTSQDKNTIRLREKRVFDNISREELLKLTEEEVLAFCANIPGIGELCTDEKGACFFYYLSFDNYQTMINDYDRQEINIEYPNGHFLKDKFYANGALLTEEELKEYIQSTYDRNPTFFNGVQLP